MNTTRINGMPWAEYISGGYMGSSALADWGHMSLEAWSAKHLEQAYQGGGSAAAAAGSALDCLLTGIEGEYQRKYVVKPEGMSFATKEGKLWKESFALPGVTILDSETAQEIAAAAVIARKAVSILSRLYGEHDCQVTLRGEDGEMRLQTRPDFAFAGHCVDLKYINSLNFEAFDRHFISGRYFLQAGLFYGLSQERPVRVSFLLVESGTLHPRCRVWEVPEHILVAGWAKCLEIAEAVEAQKSEGFFDVPSFGVLELPSWAEAKVAA